MVLKGNGVKNYPFRSSQNIDQPLSLLKDPTGPKASYTNDKSHPAVAFQFKDDPRRQERAETLPGKPLLRTTPEIPRFGHGHSHSPAHELGAEMNCNCLKSVVFISSTIVICFQW